MSSNLNPSFVENFSGRNRFQGKGVLSPCPIEKKNKHVQFKCSICKKNFVFKNLTCRVAVYSSHYVDCLRRLLGQYDENVTDILKRDQALWAKISSNESLKMSLEKRTTIVQVSHCWCSPFSPCVCELPGQHKYRHFRTVSFLHSQCSPLMFSSRA